MRLSAITRPLAQGAHLPRGLSFAKPWSIITASVGLSPVPGFFASPQLYLKSLRV